MNMKSGRWSRSYMPLDPSIDCHWAASLRTIRPPVSLVLISLLFTFSGNLNQRGNSERNDSRQFLLFLPWRTVVKMEEVRKLKDSIGGEAAVWGTEVMALAEETTPENTKSAGQANYSTGLQCKCSVTLHTRAAVQLRLYCMPLSQAPESLSLAPSPFWDLRDLCCVFCLWPSVWEREKENYAGHLTGHSSKALGSFSTKFYWQRSQGA